MGMYNKKIRPTRIDYDIEDSYQTNGMVHKVQGKRISYYNITDEQRSFIHDIAERYMELGSPTDDIALNKDIQVVWSLLDSDEYTDTDQISLNYAREWYIHTFNKW